METKSESAASNVAVVVFGVIAIFSKVLSMAYAFNHVVAAHFGIDAVTPGFVFVFLLMIGIGRASGSVKKVTNAETIKASLTITFASLMLFLAAYIVS